MISSIKKLTRGVIILTNNLTLCPTVLLIKDLEKLIILKKEFKDQTKR